MTGLPIISAAERQKEKRGVKAVIFGKSGIGKTKLLETLPVDKTLFIDLEAGDLSVEEWQGDTIRPKTWEEFRDFAVFIGGPIKAIKDAYDADKKPKPYSQLHFDAVCKKYGSPQALNKYQSYFIDSITVLARLCFQYCKEHPQSISDRTGKTDIRAAYGLHAQEMLTALTHLQHIRNKNVFFVGILDEKLDEFNRPIFVPQLEGSKTGLELPGIVDQVITMAEVKNKEGKSRRAFVNHTINPHHYPAKDRSGRLSLYEEPDLGKLVTKIARQNKTQETVNA